MGSETLGRTSEETTTTNKPNPESVGDQKRCQLRAANLRREDV